MTRVLHVSDLHFGPPAVPAQLDKIAEMISTRRFDVVAVSGDLSQRARPGEFQAARQLLRDAAKVSQIIVVPGNHDVKWWRAPLGVGSRASAIANYAKYITTDFEPVLTVPGVTFVGINTAQGVVPGTITWNPRDVGVVGNMSSAQIAEARTKFDATPQGNHRVIVMHHNPLRGEISNRYGLSRPARAAKAFADLRIDLVLCGHDHQEAVYHIEHTQYGTIVCTAGTVSDRTRGQRPSAINIVSLSPEGIEVEPQIWSVDAQNFLPGPVKRFPR
ncbi:MAG: metallophosphoesterase family protein [Gemmatimonas sp.]|nr:metallophosphoesterase [Gemmatimonadaceae bacterium]